ncbi:hypothetical protein [Streptomyces sp. NPDC058155]|uniref:hypothetical protein n=1 Tax=Streptomyces sp. NPDC058155 TaxID=3346359 RepID=UPI0036E16FD7
MGTKLPRGMGTFFKTCDCARQNRCPHAYSIRFRDATGRQREEGGYAKQQDAVDRLNKLYDEKRSTTPQQAVVKRETAKQRSGEYASTWLTRQRHYAPGTIRTTNQLLEGQILPTLESRRIDTFSAAVIDDFIASMEEHQVGLATQQNVPCWRAAAAPSRPASV